MLHGHTPLPPAAPPWFDELIALPKLAAPCTIRLVPAGFVDGVVEVILSDIVEANVVGVWFIVVVVVIFFWAVCNDFDVNNAVSTVAATVVAAVVSVSWAVSAATDITAVSLSWMNFCTAESAEDIVLEPPPNLSTPVVVVSAVSVDVLFSPITIVFVFVVIVVVVVAVSNSIPLLPSDGDNGLLFLFCDKIIESFDKDADDDKEILFFKFLLWSPSLRIVVVFAVMSFLFWAPDRRASSRMRALASFSCLSNIFFRCSSWARLRARLLFSLVASTIAEGLVAVAGDRFIMGERANNALPPLTGCRTADDNRRFAVVFVLLLFAEVFADGLLLIVVEVVDVEVSIGENSLERWRSSSLRWRTASSFSLASRSADRRTWAFRCNMKKERRKNLRSF